MTWVYENVKLLEDGDFLGFGTALAAVDESKAAFPKLFDLAVVASF